MLVRNEKTTFFGEYSIYVEPNWWKPLNWFRVHDLTGLISGKWKFQEEALFTFSQEPDIGRIYTREIHVSFYEDDRSLVVIREGVNFMVVRNAKDFDESFKKIFLQ